MGSLRHSQACKTFSDMENSDVLAIILSMFGCLNSCFIAHVGVVIQLLVTVMYVSSCATTTEDNRS